MKLGFWERLYVNSPVRHYVQRPLELWLLRRIAPIPSGAHVLEIGCGNGGGLHHIALNHNPASVTGVDLDPAQVNRARRRLSTLPIPYNVIPASAESVPLPAHTYDVLLSIGCLHHVPNWREAVAECARLLRQGGLIYALEFYSPFLNLPVIRHLFPHPKRRFTQPELAEELARHGFTLLGTSPKLNNPVKRWLASYASLSVHRLTITAPEYD